MDIINTEILNMEVVKEEDMYIDHDNEGIYSNTVKKLDEDNLNMEAVEEEDIKIYEEGVHICDEDEGMFSNTDIKVKKEDIKVEKEEDIKMDEEVVNVHDDDEWMFSNTDTEMKVQEIKTEEEEESEEKYIEINGELIKIKYEKDEGTMILTEELLNKFHGQVTYSSVELLEDRKKDYICSDSYLPADHKIINEYVRMYGNQDDSYLNTNAYVTNHIKVENDLDIDYEPITEHSCENFNIADEVVDIKAVILTEELLNKFHEQITYSSSVDLLGDNNAEDYICSDSYLPEDHMIINEYVRMYGNQDENYLLPNDRDTNHIKVENDFYIDDEAITEHGCENLNIADEVVDIKEERCDSLLKITNNKFEVKIVSGCPYQAILEDYINKLKNKSPTFSTKSGFCNELLELQRNVLDILKRNIREGGLEEKVRLAMEMRKKVIVKNSLQAKRSVW